MGVNRDSVRVPASGYYLAPDGCWNTHPPPHPTPPKEESDRGKLTLECGHKHVSIFDEVFNEPVGPLQLDLMALQPLSELRTVQERITKLERREPHGDRNVHSRLLEWIQVRRQSFWDLGGNSYALRNLEMLLERRWEGSPALFFSMPFSLSLHNFRTLERRRVTGSLWRGYKTAASVAIYKRFIQMQSYHNSLVSLRLTE